MKQHLSLPEWHRMAREGHAPPMRIQVTGISMFPLLRSQKDYVTIQPIEDVPGTGDIVLFSDPRKAGHYVLHRVWQTEVDMVLPWGDNCKFPDGWVPLTHVWGKAELIERGRRRIRPDPVKGLRLAKFWHVAGRGWRFAVKVKNWARHRLRRLTHRRK